MTPYIVGGIIGLVVGSLGALISMALVCGGSGARRVLFDREPDPKGQTIKGYQPTHDLEGLSRKDNKMARPPFPPDTKRGHRPYSPSVPPRRPGGEPPRVK